jgi:hypothetical protein
MLQNRTRSGSLLLAGLAAFAYYKYSKMTPEERRSMFDGLKEKGKKLINDYVPENIRDKFMKKDNANSMDNVAEGSYYPA